MYHRCISLLLITITYHYSWPGPGPAPCAGAAGPPVRGPGEASADGPSERAQLMELHKLRLVWMLVIFMIRSGNIRMLPNLNT